MMKYITYMRCAASLLALLLLATSCSNSEPPTPQEPQENTFKAKFTAMPNTFSGYGGYGKVHGMLQELSPSGELLYETPLEDSEFTLHFERYPTGIRPCEYGRNEFFVQGDVNAETFKIKLRSSVARVKAVSRPSP